jgi:serine/threonine-protein kinase
LITERISHYKIIRKLGAGGMGEVYLAEDTRLFRQVALKLLPASYQYDPGRRAGFLKEARAASALRSPNTAAIYDIGEHEGLSFIVMEYVEGELLSERIARGALAVSDAIAIATQVAEALDEAHTRGITHRDIKGSNIMITPRHLAKLLDFGLAQMMLHLSEEAAHYQTAPLDENPKESAELESAPTQSLNQDTQPTAALDPAADSSDPAALLRTIPEPTSALSDEQLGKTSESKALPSRSSGQVTTIGVLKGTLPYMSPEQARGEALDTRTDIFSLGVVFYEMLAGRLPFWSHTPDELIKQITHDEPPSLANLNQAVFPELERITRKCLEKERDKRYQTASDLLTDLHGLQKDCDSGGLRENRLIDPITGERKAIDSLAILPFENASGDSDAEYLSDGITESIINSLSQLPNLRVMARSTVFRYKGKNPDTLTVARELNVRGVLSGRVFQRGDRLMIKAELVDSADGAQIWGEQFNRQLNDIFAIEEEISREISEKLRLKLTGEEKKRLSKRHTQNIEAYQEYMKGRYLWNQRTRDSLFKCIDHFNRAIDLDPNYALAYAGLADARNIIASYSSQPPAEAFPKARSAATRALALDNTLAEAHTALAFVMLGYDWEYAEAEKQFKLALSLNHGYATAHLWYALLLVALERHDEAMAEMQKALELDPLSLPIRANLGWLLYLERKYDEAIVELRRTLEVEPNFLLARRRLCQVYIQKGMYTEAADELERALVLAPEDTEIIGLLGYYYAVTGKHEASHSMFHRLEDLAQQRYIPAYFFARIYVGLDNKDCAFDFLEKAYEERYGLLAYMRVDPELDPLRADPRFADLMQRVKLT